MQVHSRLCHVNVVLVRALWWGFSQASVNLAVQCSKSLCKRFCNVYYSFDFIVLWYGRVVVVTEGLKAKSCAKHYMNWSKRKTFNKNLILKYHGFISNPSVTVKYILCGYSKRPFTPINKSDQYLTHSITFKGSFSSYNTCLSWYGTFSYIC